MADDLTNTLKLSSDFWKKFAIRIKSFIYKDLLKGEVQAYIPQTTKTVNGAERYSDQYAFYKGRSMRRISDNKRLGSPRTLKNGKQIVPKQNNISGVSLMIQNKKPDMLLTGQTIKGLEYESSGDDYLIMAYKQKDAEKILGNEDFGRDIRTLNEKNFDLAVDLIEEELNGQIDNYLKNPIIIKL